jgi:PAS domain S-box-containing protein
MDRGTLAQQPITRFICPADQDTYYRHRQALFATDQPQACELRMVKKDGTSFWAQLVATAAPPAAGAPVCRIVLTDLAETRRAAEVLRENEAKLRLLADNVPAVMAYVSVPDRRYRFVNRGYAEVFGIEPELAVGKLVSEIMEPAAYARALPYIDRASAGERVGYENLFPVRGEPRWFSVRYVPELDPQGAVRSLIVMAVDITELKQAQAERERLESHNWQLQKAESLGRMAGAIAHHFNNQLQAVTGNLELAMNDLPRQSGPGANLAAALQAAHRAAEVSGLMLTYLGQWPAQRQPLDLAAVCQQSLTLLRAALPGGVLLGAALPAPGPTVCTNANQIQQVLTNLVTNAWEALPDGREPICVNLQTVAAAAIPTAQRFPVDWQPQAQEYACLEVADRGAGIAAQDVEKLFDPFFSTKFTGRGLGLSVVLGIVRAHHGAITVASELGRGSVFRVFLPVSTAAVVLTPTPAAPALLAAGRGTVLVVEDEPAVRITLAYALKYWGYTVLEAEDGVAAVEVFRQHPDAIRCVLCDLTLPRLNGWETLTALRELQPGIPVILSSGYDEVQAMAGEHPERPQAFLRKPYELKVLNDTLHQVLSPREEVSP